MPEARFTNRLAFFHGFTQTHHHWHATARSIAVATGTEPALAFVDLPGHGLSTADTASIEQASAKMPALVGPGTWIGYSMGGRHALLAALTHEPEVERLVLIGATPGIEDETERARRVELDAQRAARVEAIGVDAFLVEWLAAPMFADLPGDPSDVEHRRRNTTSGLAHSLRTGGTGTQPSVWNRLAETRLPTLVLAGENDIKFTTVGRAMVERLPQGAFVAIPAAGHAAHTEQPDAVAEVIAGWMAQTD